MQEIHKWSDYEEVVTQLARETLKSWMIGVEICDLKNEIWIEFFETVKHEPLIKKAELIQKLKTFASNYKKQERERVFGKDELELQYFIEIQGEEYRRHWDVIQEIWDEFIYDLTNDDAVLMQMMGRGIQVPVIMNHLKISRAVFFDRKKLLLAQFKRRIDERLRIDKAR